MSSRSWSGELVAAMTFAVFLPRGSRRHTYLQDLHVRTQQY